jgi:ElaB/YqjD/DUF883 family membrane-anchored ribosome-binding protein
MGENRDDEVTGSYANDPSRLRADIERTREELSETMGEISDRLAPGQLAADAKETLKQAATERMRVMSETASQVAEDITGQARAAATGVVEHVRQNPWPSALLGIGVGWLLYHNLSSRPGSTRVTSTDPGYAFDERDSPPWNGEPARFEAIRDNSLPALCAGVGLAWLVSRSFAREVHTSYPAIAYNEYNDLAARAEDGGSWPGTGPGRDWTQAARDAGHRMRDAGHRVREAAAGAARRATDATRQATDRVGRATTETQHWLTRQVEEHPLSVGLIAIAAGAGIGLALPATEAESRWMGRQRDELLSKARSLANETVSKVGS